VHEGGRAEHGALAALRDEAQRPLVQHGMSIVGVDDRISCTPGRAVSWMSLDDRASMCDVCATGKRPRGRTPCSL
jgi:hypothetical protein